MKRIAVFLAGTALGTQPVLGQESDVREAGEIEISDSEIIVTGRSLRGLVDVPQAPIQELDAEDIAAYGAGSIAELVAQLAPATGSARGRGGGGRPVFLVNGIRVASFREFRSYPPEAIEKVEILPEEVAQRFGFDPDRRVINFILQDNFSSIENETEFEMPSRGGYRRIEREFGLLKITGGGRINANVEFADVSPLTEDERDITQPDGVLPDVSTDPDPVPFRTLVADSVNYEASVNYAKALGETGGSIGLNATVERVDRTTGFGLDSVLLTDPDGASALRTLNEDDPLQRFSRTDTYAFAASFNRPVGDWQLTATLDARYEDILDEIDQPADISSLVADAASGALAIDGPLPSIGSGDVAIATEDAIITESLLTVRGAPLLLPAGELSMTFDLGYDWASFETDDSRAAGPVTLRRGDLFGGANIGIPIASTREGVWDALGDIDLNLRVGFNEISDFGTLGDWSAGISWAPFDNFDLSATYVNSEIAPGLTELGDPEITQPNQAFFDFVNGETVLASVTTGGNPNLLAETQSDWKFSANWNLPVGGDWRLVTDFVTNRSDNVTADFPALTPEIEAAFPGRTTRDSTGRLVAIDLRPVTFFQTSADRLSFGLTSRGSVGKARAPEGRGGPPPGTRSGGGRPGGPPPGIGRGADGPPEGMRAMFGIMREGLCGDDSEAFINRLQRYAAGEIAPGSPDAEGFPPEFQPEIAARMLERFTAEDGTIDQSRLAMAKERICSMDGPPGGGAQAGERASQPQGRRGGGLPFGRRGDGRGRYFLNLTHTIELSNEIILSEGSDPLDILAGEGASGFGTSRHSTRLEAGLFWNGIGTRISGRYTGQSRVVGTDGDPASDLSFGALATIDLRVFFNLQEVLKQDTGFFKGTRLSLRADNIFDGRRAVVDGNGDTPLRFQPFLIDPTGRYVGIDFRKLF